MHASPVIADNVIHNTFVIERSYPASLERVFAAFSDAAKKRRWYAEGESHAVETFEMDFRVGGVERTAYRMNDKTPFPGVVLATEGSFQDIIPGRRVVIASTMTLGERRISSSLVTIELAATAQGCDLICTHQAVYFEGADGPQMREGGWRALFDRLATALAA